MSMQTKTIGRMPTDHGPYDPQLAYGKKFIVTLFDCGWESKHDNNTSAPATLNAQAGTITENTTDWKKKWGSYKQWLIDNGYQKMDASKVKDGNNTQHDINAAFANEIGSDSTPGSIKGRVTTLEGAVGTGGSVDERIATEGAKHYLKSETYTKEEVNGMITTPDQGFESVSANSETTAATDVLPATGEADTIYRVANWDGSQYDTSVYSEYSWNTSTNTYIKLSTKQVGIDVKPTAGSHKLVESGGVISHLNKDWQDKSNIDIKVGSINDGSSALNRLHFYFPLRVYSYITISSSFNFYAGFLTEDLQWIEGATEWTNSFDIYKATIPQTAFYIDITIRDASDPSARLDGRISDVLNAITISTWKGELQKDFDNSKGILLSDWEVKEKSLNVKVGTLEDSTLVNRLNFTVPLYTYYEFGIGQTFDIGLNLLDKDNNIISGYGQGWGKKYNIISTFDNIPSNAVAVNVVVRYASNPSQRIDGMISDFISELEVRTWKSFISEQVVDMSDKMDSLEGNGLIRDFFVTEMNKTIKDCNDVIGGWCMVCTIIADNHWVDTADRRRQNSDTLSNLKYFNNNVYSDAIIHLGDIVGLEEYSVLQKTNKEIQTDLGAYLAKFNKLGDNILVTNGNHDGDEAVTFNAVMWEGTQSRTNYANSRIVQDSTTLNFYWDYERLKVRVVFIANPAINKQWEYTQNSMLWLKNTLGSLQDGWNVIIMSHIPFMLMSPFDGQELGNVDSFIGICNAFNGHTTYSDNIVSVDFSSFTTSKILCQVYGHTHSDKLWAVGESYNGYMIDPTTHELVAHTYTNEMPCPVVFLAANWMVNGESPNIVGGTMPQRVDKTATQDLWTVMVYQPSLNKIYFKRFGAGDDFTVNV